MSKKSAAAVPRLENEMLGHPLRRVRLELIEPHLRKAGANMSRGDFLLAYQAFVDAWMSIVDKELPGGPVMQTLLADLEGPWINLRILNAMEKAEVDTIGDVTMYSRDEYLAMMDFGPESHARLMEGLFRYLLDRCRVLESLVLKETEK